MKKKTLYSVTVIPWNLERFKYANANFQKNLPKPVHMNLVLKYSNLLWITENFTWQRKSWVLFSIQGQGKVILPWFLEWYIHNSLVKFVWEFNHAKHAALLFCIVYFSHQQTLLQMKIHSNPQNKNAHVCTSAPSNLKLNDVREEQNSIKQPFPILDGASPSTGILCNIP